MYEAPCHLARALRAALLSTTLLSVAGCVPELGISAPEPPAGECNPTGYDALALAFAPCDLFTCTVDAAANARCVGKEFITDSSQLSSLSECHDAQGQAIEGVYCVPVPFLTSNGLYTPPTCRSIGGLEGRCLSKCLPEVNAQIDTLPQDTCGEGELCAPCYDPSKHELTNACKTNACDTPPASEPDYCALDYASAPAANLDELHACPASVCPSGGAHCMKSSNIDPAQLDNLADCDATSKCVPDEMLVHAGNYLPKSCRANGGVEGRCQSLCLPEVAKNADLLERADCDDGQVCVPCYDPSQNNRDTKACRSSECDAPAEPPADVCKLDYDAHPLANPDKLPACPASVCASGKAHCVAIEKPTDQQQKLGKCDDGTYCVPDAFIENGGNVPAATCLAYGGKAEGRCQSLCIPDVAEQKDSLEQSTCADDERCVPCFDPRNGEDTQACSGNCDQPVQAPYQFEACCNDQATCVPQGSVPESKRGSFKTCEGDSAGFLCVPNEYLDNPDYERACTDDTGAAGACVSKCVNNVDLVGKPDLECDANQLCVPCKTEVPFLSEILKSILGDGAIDTGACAAPSGP